MFTRFVTNTGSQFPRRHVGEWRIRPLRQVRLYEPQTLCAYPRLPSVPVIGFFDELQQQFELNSTSASNCVDCRDEWIWTIHDGGNSIWSVASSHGDDRRNSDLWRYRDFYGSVEWPEWHILGWNCHRNRYDRFERSGNLIEIHSERECRRIFSDSLHHGSGDQCQL